MSTIIDRPEYLTWYLIAVGIGFGLQLALRAQLLRRADVAVQGPPLTPTEVGRLRGEAPAVAVALTWIDAARTHDGAPPEEFDAFTETVLEHLDAGDIDPERVRRARRPELDAMKQRLEERRLLAGATDRWLLRTPLIAFLVYGVGTTVWTAATGDALIALMAAGLTFPAIALAMPLAGFGRTAAGDDLLDELQRTHVDREPEQIALAVALFGSAALTADPPEDATTTLHQFADTDHYRWQWGDGGGSA